jgi:DNA-binding MarR family transcriptional regulator
MSTAIELTGLAPVSHSPNIDVLERELSYLVRALEAIQRRRSYPLDRAQYLLLGVLEGEGPQSIATLAERLLLDDSTVTRQIAAMETRALVDRRSNPKDGRSILVYATRRGLSVRKRMRELRLGRINALIDDWAGSERADLARLLIKLNASLKRSLSDD